MPGIFEVVSLKRLQEGGAAWGKKRLLAGKISKRGLLEGKVVGGEENQLETRWWKKGKRIHSRDLHRKGGSQDAGDAKRRCWCLPGGGGGGGVVTGVNLLCRAEA